MALRPYQVEADAAIHAAWEEYKRVLLVLPTGTGKTCVFSKIAHDEAIRGRRTLIVAHRDELIRQAQSKLLQFTGLDSDIDKADEVPSGMHLVTIGSVQTLSRPGRLTKAQEMHYDTIIVDEAHHCLSETYQRVLSAFPDAKVLGVTATPDRGDKRNLASYFETLAYEYPLRKAIDEGFLCKIVAQTVPLKIDLGKIRTTAGDFNDLDLGNALDPYIPQIADAVAEIDQDRKTLVFVPLIATSVRFTKELVSRGIAAEHIDGTSADRRNILSRFNTGETRLVTNSMLLTEGFDQPDIGCIVCLRPTKIRSLYAQIIGRGTRIAPDKSDLLILDFLWHIERHSLCHPANLIAASTEVAEKITALQEDRAGQQLDLEDLEEEVERSATEDRERALAEALKAQSHKKRRTVDPLAFAIATHDKELQEYEPLFGWQKAKPSDAQLAVLARFGIDTEAIQSRGHASIMLDRLIKRAREKLATAKQLRILADYGYPSEATTTFDKAKEYIDQIAASGWRKR
jgi:superfamily II DNA or RNA helicase